jgi:hypothetical protein
MSLVVLQELPVLFCHEKGPPSSDGGAIALGLPLNPIIEYLLTQTLPPQCECPIKEDGKEQVSE